MSAPPKRRESARLSNKTKASFVPSTPSTHLTTSTTSLTPLIPFVPSNNNTNHRCRMCQQQTQRIIANQKDLAARVIQCQRNQTTRVTKAIVSAQKPKRRKAVSDMGPKQRGIVLNEFDEIRRSELGDDIDSMEIVVQRIEKKQPQIIHRNIERYDKHILAKRKKQSERLVYSDGHAYFDLYTNSRYVQSMNSSDCKRRFKEGKRVYILKADMPAILSQPRNVLERQFTPTNRLYKSLFNYGLTHYERERVDCRVYLFGEIQTEAQAPTDSQNLIAFTTLNASIRFYLVRQLLNVAYFNNSGHYHWLHIQKPLHLHIGVGGDNEYICDEITTFDEA
eukprot:1002981_1